MFPNTFLTAFGDSETVTFDTARLGVGVVFSDAPVITAPVAAGDTSVSGTSSEADSTAITFFVNSIERATTTVTGGAWTVSGLAPLFSGQRLTATAQAPGEEVSDLSAPVIVEATSGRRFGGPDGGTGDGGGLDGGGLDGGGLDGGDGGTGGGDGGCGCRVAASHTRPLGVVLLGIPFMALVISRRRRRRR
ncbi:MAG: hypothetical protein JRH11_19690 [Deltaproteobacteria bacterium]|nr:hypothetical protein [Deltaproteobacteria bacterium]